MASRSSCSYVPLQNLEGCYHPSISGRGVVFDRRSLSLEHSLEPYRYIDLQKEP